MSPDSRAMAAHERVDGLVARVRPTLTRRALLGWAGVGTAMVAVGGASALSLRAVGQGVLTPSEGGAYEAWSDWRGRAGEGALRFVRAAVLASNGHNTQPWLFVVHRDRIDLFADATRGEGALDPLGRELHLSLGCALENLALSAGAHGTDADIALLPDPANPTYVATAALVAGQASDSGELYDAIPHRHTNRYPFDQARLLAASQLAEIDRLVDQPDLSVVWFSGRGDKDRFGELTIAATRDAIADREVAAVDHAWFRHSQSTIDAHKDGLNIDGAGLPDATVAAAKLLPEISGADLRQRLPLRNPGPSGPHRRRVRCHLRDDPDGSRPTVGSRAALAADPSAHDGPGLGRPAHEPGARASGPGTGERRRTDLHGRAGSHAPGRAHTVDAVPHRLPDPRREAQPPPTSRRRHPPCMTHGRVTRSASAHCGGRRFSLCSLSTTSCSGSARADRPDSSRLRARS